MALMQCIAAERLLRDERMHPATSCCTWPTCTTLRASTCMPGWLSRQWFADLLDVLSPMQLVAGENPDAEAEYWSIFADVFEREVSADRCSRA